MTKHLGRPITWTEMADLPDNSVVIDRDGDNYIKKGGKWYPKLFAGGWDDKSEKGESIFAGWSPLTLIREGVERVVHEHDIVQPPHPPGVVIDVAGGGVDPKGDVLFVNHRPVAQRWEIPKTVWDALTENAGDAT